MHRRYVCADGIKKRAVQVEQPEKFIQTDRMFQSGMGCLL